GAGGGVVDQRVAAGLAAAGLLDVGVAGEGGDALGHVVVDAVGVALDQVAVVVDLAQARGRAGQHHAADARVGVEVNGGAGAGGLERALADDHVALEVAGAVGFGHGVG